MDAVDPFCSTILTSLASLPLPHLHCPFLCPHTSPLPSVAPSHSPPLTQRHFDVARLDERLGPFPYLTFISTPHYIFIGRKRATA